MLFCSFAILRPVRAPTRAPNEPSRDRNVPPLLHRSPPHGAGARIPAHPHSGDGSGGLVLCGDRRREAAISRERVRQIVAQALEAGDSESKLVHARVQIARLEPALRLAARSVADGELSAIDRLLRVLDRLDRYAALDGAGSASYAASGRERLLAKLNRMAENIKRHRELHGDAPPGEADSPDADDWPDADDSTTAEAALDAPQTADS